MRAELLSYLTANLTGSIKVSNELPFDQGGNALYLRNMRKIYLDEPYIVQEEFIPTLDSNGISRNITHIKGYLAVDAKNRNIDLDAALNSLGMAKNTSAITDSFRREFDYITTIDNDILLYEVEYRFYNIA
jgi:hypothetical protein